ncbi:MAG TPA: amidohydrolase [Vicinamibacteria bacterium]|nr:amidohydrolase [Vicinamibacteria bacterium]
MLFVGSRPESHFSVYALVAIGSVVFGSSTAKGALHADRVLVNGNIITVDAHDSVVEALAIRGGRIVAVGTNDEIEALIGPDTERIDLEGLTATPGLLDMHCHFASGGLSSLYELDLSYPNIESVEGAAEKVREQVEAVGAGQWVEGRGWDEGKLLERRYIFARDLDPVSPDNPVFLTHTMGHYAVANSVALGMANISRDTPDPFGGTIDRDDDGEPTGVLKETAQSLVSSLIPDATFEQRKKGIAYIAKEFNKEGMTGLKDPGIGLETWKAYQELLAEGELPVRVFVLWRSGPDIESAEALIDRVAPFTKPYISTGDDHLISGGIKLMIDGSGGARTAWLHDDWNKNATGVDTGNRGYPVTDPDVLRRQVRMYHDAGLHVSIHSIGDRAIDWTMDSYAEALEANPVRGLRHGIIHANIPTDRAIDLMAELEEKYDAAYPEPSATFMWWIGDTYAGNFGPKRALRLNPFKTFLSKGIPWANGSDFSVTPFPARYGLWASVARETLLGVYGKNPYGTEEAVGIREALRSHTRWAARQMFLEDEIGSLEVDKYADIAVWDKDLYNVPTEELETLKCQMTIFEGEVVFRR